MEKKELFKTLGIKDQSFKIKTIGIVLIILASLQLILYIALMILSKLHPDMLLFLKDLKGLINILITVNLIYVIVMILNLSIGILILKRKRLGKNIIIVVSIMSLVYLFYDFVPKVFNVYEFKETLPIFLAFCVNCIIPAFFLFFFTRKSVKETFLIYNPQQNFLDPISNLMQIYIISFGVLIISSLITFWVLSIFGEYEISIFQNNIPNLSSIIIRFMLIIFYIIIVWRSFKLERTAIILGLVFTIVYLLLIEIPIFKFLFCRKTFQWFLIDYFENYITRLLLGNAILFQIVLLINPSSFMINNETEQFGDDLYKKRLHKLSLLYYTKAYEKLNAFNYPYFQNKITVLKEKIELTKKGEMKNHG